MPVKHLYAKQGLSPVCFVSCEYQTVIRTIQSIEPLLPRQRGSVPLTSLNVLSAILYVIGRRCKWCRLSAYFGSWYTIYTLANRRGNAGVLDRFLQAIQEKM